MNRLQTADPTSYDVLMRQAERIGRLWPYYESHNLSLAPITLRDTLFIQRAGQAGLDVRQEDLAVLAYLEAFVSLPNRAIPFGRPIADAFKTLFLAGMVQWYDDQRTLSPYTDAAVEAYRATSQGQAIPQRLSHYPRIILLDDAEATIPSKERMNDNNHLYGNGIILLSRTADKKVMQSEVNHAVVHMMSRIDGGSVSTELLEGATAYRQRAMDREQGLSDTELVGGTTRQARYRAFHRLEQVLTGEYKLSQKDAQRMLLAAQENGFDDVSRLMGGRSNLEKRYAALVTSERQSIGLYTNFGIEYLTLKTPLLFNTSVTAVPLRVLTNWRYRVRRLFLSSTQKTLLDEALLERIQTAVSKASMEISQRVGSFKTSHPDRYDALVTLTRKLYPYQKAWNNSSEREKRSRLPNFTDEEASMLAYMEKLRQIPFNTFDDPAIDKELYLAGLIRRESDLDALTPYIEQAERTYVDVKKKYIPEEIHSDPLFPDKRAMRLMKLTLLEIYAMTGSTTLAGIVFDNRLIAITTREQPFSVKDIPHKHSDQSTVNHELAHAVDFYFARVWVKDTYGDSFTRQMNEALTSYWQYEMDIAQGVTEQEALDDQSIVGYPVELRAVLSLIKELSTSGKYSTNQAKALFLQSQYLDFGRVLDAIGGKKVFDRAIEEAKRARKEEKSMPKSQLPPEPSGAGGGGEVIFVQPPHWLGNPIKEGTQQVNGRYEILADRIVSTSMSRIALALDHETGTLVMVKYPIINDKALIDAIYREASLLDTFSQADAAVLPKIELVEQNALPFLITEYIGQQDVDLDGKPISHDDFLTLVRQRAADVVAATTFTLEDVLTHKQWVSVDDVQDVLRTIARTLDAVNAQGVVHLDVKPANIFLVRSPNGIRAVLGDFALARRPSELTEVDKDSIPGTAGYIAPELVNEALGMTVAADQWSLAAMLYGLVSNGDHPLVTYNDAFAYAYWLLHLDTYTYHPLNALFIGESVITDPAIVDAFNTVLAKALAKQPSERFGSNQEFIDALEPAFDQIRSYVSSKRGQPAEHLGLGGGDEVGLPAVTAAEAWAKKYVTDPAADALENGAKKLEGNCPTVFLPGRLPALTEESGFPRFDGLFGKNVVNHRDGDDSKERGNLRLSENMVNIHEDSSNSSSALSARYNNNIPAAISKVNDFPHLISS
ncbi:protein kinase [Candidatus Gottesmanbacteria bacterium]|nr:protein kinase [Candidatus Gottesmanbacteria bacterium]